MLSDKVVLVTGAGRGIGSAIAYRMARENAIVIINYNGSSDKAMALAADIQAEGLRAEAWQCNVSDGAAVKEMIDAIVKKHGAIDIVVNNAGITKDTLLMRMSDADFDAVIDINLKGAFNCMKAASKYMLKQRNGRIINISSVVGRMGNAGQVNYAASKAGLIGMTMSAARELASRNITVNAIAPGFIQTEMTDLLPEEARQRLTQAIPLGCLGEAADVAAAAAFLASDQARYITGQILSVDGGMYMG